VDSMEVGGSELNAIRTLERLDQSRFALRVFHTGSAGPLLARYQALGVPLHHVRIRGFLRPGALLTGVRLARTFRAQAIEILHCHDIYSNILAVPWARVAGVPVIIASRRWQGAVPSRGHAWANRMASRWASAVLANSPGVARSVIEEDGVRPQAVQVIPNFLEREAFEPYPAELRERLFGALGIPTDALLIGIVARLSPVKDHATLLAALPPLLAERPDLHLLIVGEGPLRPVLEAQAAALSFGSRIHFAGQQHRLPNPHALLDISVLSSRTEGFPNAIIEAMAAGRPVVATAVGGTLDAVRSEETGLLVPPANPTALSAALRELLNAPARRSSMGEVARRIARTEYAEDKVLGRLADWYESLLGRRPPYQQIP
jgi:glycosyltransferase involved in cell wall biosynthesis